MQDTVLVTADSLRADHCGWQSSSSLTPNLDKLAADSLTFSTAVAPGPRTLSSVPATHTGTPFAVTNHDTSNYADRIARIQSHINRFESISERFKEKGYRTIAFTANPWTSAENDFDTGFDVFREVGREGGGLENLFEGTPIQTPVRLFDQWVHKDAWFSQWRTFYDEIIDAINETEEPVFAWVFLLDTHNPYIVPRADQEELSSWQMYSTMVRANSAFNQSGTSTHYKSSLSDELVGQMKAAYRDSVRSVDNFTGQLLEDINDETVFVFHSDHGEAFGEHNTFGHEPCLFEENIHVPLLVANTDETATITEPVSTTNLPEMALSYASSETPDPSKWTSNYVVARNESDSAISVRGSRWKYIDSSGDEQLYDLSSDPEEQDNVLSDYPDVAAELRTQRNEYIAELPDPPSETESVESDEMRQHLESLGYLQE